MLAVVAPAAARARMRVSTGLAASRPGVGAGGVSSWTRSRASRTGRSSDGSPTGSTVNSPCRSPPFAPARQLTPTGYRDLRPRRSASISRSTCAWERGRKRSSRLRPRSCPGAAPHSAAIAGLAISTSPYASHTAVGTGMRSSRIRK